MRLGTNHLFLSLEEKPLNWVRRWGGKKRENETIENWFLPPVEASKKTSVTQKVLFKIWRWKKEGVERKIRTSRRWSPVAMECDVCACHTCFNWNSQRVIQLMPAWTDLLAPSSAASHYNMTLVPDFNIFAHSLLWKLSNLKTYILACN